MKNIRKNDEVKVLTGKDKGKTGKVLQIIDDNKCIVEKINIVKKHMKPSQKFQGGIIEKPAAIELSNVMLVCPACSKETRVDKSKVVQGKRVRSCKQCGEMIDKT